MYTVLITADFHIHDYGTHNPTPYFRLGQFAKLGKMMLETAKEKDAKEIWFCGDMLGVSSETPRTMNALKQILDSFTNAGITVRIILGNHDVAVRNSSTEISEYDNYNLISLLSENQRIHVYKSEIVDIPCGKTVHFQSWVPGNKFEPKKADYLVAHGDFDKSLSPFVPEESFIDVSGYKKAFVGHIHVPKEIGNAVSPGTPIMHSYSDNSDNSFIIFDAETEEMERIPTGDQFLKFIYAKTEEEALKLEESLKSENKEAVIRIKEVKTKQEIKDLDLSDLDIDPRKVLSKFTENLSKKSLGILDGAISGAAAEIQTPDLRVEFEHLYAKNFLSIKNLDFDFRKYQGLTVITGHVGAGKSTLFNLIQFMLFGKLPSRTKADYSIISNEPFSGSLTLKYKKHDYRIERTLDSLEFYKDGKPIESAKKQDLQKTLESELSFMRFFSLIYVHQGSTGIFSDMSDTGRVSFLSNLIGLDLIKIWTDCLESAVKEQKNNITEISGKIIAKESKTEELQKFNSENSEHSSFKDNSSILEKIKELVKIAQALKTARDNLNTSIFSEKQKLRDIENNIAKAKTLIASINAQKAKIRELSETSKQITAKIESENAELSLMPKKEIPDMTEITNAQQEVDSDIVKLTAGMAKIEDKLDHLKNHPENCPTCGQRWEIPNLSEAISELEEKKLKISAILSQKTLEKDELRKQISEIGQLHEHNAARQRLQNKIESHISEAKSCEEMLKTLRENTDLNLENLRGYADFTETEKDIIVNSYLNADTGKIDENISELSGKVLKIEESEIKNQSMIDECNRELGAIEINNKICEKIAENNKTIADLHSEIADLRSEAEEIEKCVSELTVFGKKVLSEKGLLVASLLSKVSDYLNHDKMLKVETIEELSNGNLKPTLNIKLRVSQLGKDKFVDYAFLSGGQRLQADLRFLAGIASTLGSVSVMFLDELFKFFSTEAILEGVEIIKTMNIGSVFLIIHGMRGEDISQKCIHARLDEKLGSIYE